ALGRLPCHPDALRVLAGARRPSARPLLLSPPRRQRLGHRAAFAVKDRIKKRVLFLCTGNAARSQMAEGIANAFHGDVVEAVSAGSRPAGWVHPMAIRAMADAGVDIGAAESKGASQFLDEMFDVVVTVCDSRSEEHTSE